MISRYLTFSKLKRVIWDLAILTKSTITLILITLCGFHIIFWKTCFKPVGGPGPEECVLPVPVVYEVSNEESVLVDRVHLSVHLSTTITTIITITTPTAITTITKITKTTTTKTTLVIVFIGRITCHSYDFRKNPKVVVITTLWYSD